MTARDRFILKFKRAVRHMRPRHVVQEQQNRRTIKRFAESVGLVYFGRVDRRGDDHRLIRGHTVSATHRDNHYCVGTVRGYDVMLAIRNDIVKCPNTRSNQRCHWLIVAIDLHAKADVPHFYVGHRSRDKAYAASYGSLHPVAIGGLAPYPHQFIGEYTVYGKASYALEIERLVTPQMAMVVASHFVRASFEVKDKMVYLYIESERPDTALLEKMLSNGLWLAEQIDEMLSSRP